LEGQERMDIANKEREEQGRTNMVTKEGQRGRKNKKREEVGYVTSQKQTYEIPNQVLQD